MGRAETTTIIHAPIETVWNALNDIDHTKDWVVGLENAEMKTSGEYGQGSIYYDYNRLGPFLQTTPWQVTVFEPVSRQEHLSKSASMPSTIRFELTPTPEGTRVRMAVEFQVLPRLGIIGRALDRLVLSRAVPRIIAQNLANLDAYLNPASA